MLAHPDILEKGSTELKNNATYICICRALPTTQAEAYTTYCLGKKAVSSSDFTLGASGDGGRKCTIAQISDIPITASGNWTYTAIVDGTRLLIVSVPEEIKAVYDGGLSIINEWYLWYPPPGENRYVHTDVLDQGFTEIKTDCTHVCMVSQMPSTRAEAYNTSADGGYCLGRASVTTTNFTWGDHTAGAAYGRALTVSALPNIFILVTGKWKYTAFTDATRLLCVTRNMAEEQVYLGRVVPLPSKVFLVPGPVLPA